MIWWKMVDFYCVISPIAINVNTYVGSKGEQQNSPMSIGSNIWNGDRTLHKPNTYWM